MQSWEITKKRAITTLALWQHHAPALKIGGRGVAELDALVDAFEPLAKEQVVKQNDVDHACRAQRGTLAKLTLLGTQVPQIIRGHLGENKLLMEELKKALRTRPRTEDSTLTRARELYPVWVRANAALAALTPPQPPVVRVVGQEEQTAATFKALLDGFSGQVQATSDAQGILKAAKQALADLAETTDSLIKAWYQVMKASHDPGSSVRMALSTIPTEGGTPAPGIIEISTVVQGGADGLHVEAEYVPGGGEHATTRLLKYMVVGVDAGFTHSVPLEAAGTVIGPFAVGNVVKLLTEVSNSAGTRTSAERTITIEPPIV
ncbi:MAG: hypothetical protein JNG86_20860 [Verrucomicrobiaceae bacterium]|nr:hypothetical protein [Verrucomicrobiaceae bacterium]